ncbi:MAG: hypothetical protein UV61_C0011G0041 [Candidatus Gottesmanbacteria bacterium GW2011_GWB1_43_11]|uniref:Uncharacterized protein n=1 Tax=Candidatus Gottesmanbacteria bacterium GW2011_GWB1_43_11 TaxID=1618446 RepID=A0A0G1FHR7_9BACT|nr:MAG: hypothetical protein UV17_C0067G0004 [Candidatus Gottesmanbacteria bacterium GW2011_GWA1_42_26]KKS82032.1 MAG: hypothetical protein UV55_C0006G0039 [Candidatus Gottesmanbacteria bacterium GW2011_GWC1_43_10]KKS86393.1 MAG: hypothetical protein UV61_C0011G0041 [Candidatus Gottesmanbacteria bacterium GW2011_GWB1_43_11]OGG09593.1 MAG: hypothetical protein A2699_02755 [Candidatus Gottesmanbacteria bacterium RIFCSPHIGHO2_01_FULL_43_15]OGG27614.1 MAG: hypothetical protein A3A59_03185 [Candidat
MVTKNRTAINYQIIRQTIEDILTEKLEHLPTKKEFNQKMDNLYTQNDKIIKELEDIRADNAISSNQPADHEERITDLENIHPQGKHTPLS